jgi:hypothetical protein
VLPSDFTREVPARGWRWLLQYGLPYSYWQPYTGYSEKDERLIITIPDTSNVAFSLGRYIGESSSEGNHASRRKWYAYGNCHESAHLLYPGWNKEGSEGNDIRGDYLESREVVLVEDIISAHKVGQTNACIPLFGTHISDPVVNLLRFIGLPVVLWLDKDQENGIQKKAMGLSILLNKPVRYIFTSADPKLHSVNQIKDILNESV